MLGLQSPGERDINLPFSGQNVFSNVCHSRSAIVCRLFHRETPFVPAKSDSCRYLRSCWVLKRCHANPCFYSLRFLWNAAACRQGEFGFRRAELLLCHCVPRSWGNPSVFDFAAETKQTWASSKTKSDVCMKKRARKLCSVLAPGNWQETVGLWRCEVFLFLNTWNRVKRIRLGQSTPVWKNMNPNHHGSLQWRQKEDKEKTACYAWRKKAPNLTAYRHWSVFEKTLPRHLSATLFLAQHVIFFTLHS